MGRLPCQRARSRDSLLVSRYRHDDLTELRPRLGGVRKTIGRHALDYGVCHLGDIAVAAHPVTCREVPGLKFDRDYQDLVAYSARVRPTSGD